MNQHMVKSLVLAGVIAAKLPAQTTGHPACPPDTLAAPLDSTIDTVFAWVPEKRDSETDIAFGFRSGQVRAVLGATDTLPILPEAGYTMVLGPMEELPPPLQAAAVAVLFQVRDDGRLAGMHVARFSPWPPLDVALQRAILRADSQHLFSRVPPSLEGQVIDLYVAAGAQRLPNALNEPVARVWRIERRGHWVRTEPAPLQHHYAFDYPDAALRRGIGDIVLLEFVVDTTGRVDPQSIFPLRATYREFAEAAAQMIRSTRYRPGTLNGCPVPTREQVYFRFGSDL